MGSIPVVSETREPAPALPTRLKGDDFQRLSAARSVVGKR
ncbi:hypothetical protein FH063_002455 [Azospirillum argentinense]|uniref:Uncharacterized protein n=1 Tax=Azospirillum argentinense TaxID=2970906 RepID=A0A5B0KQ53_9PROT|nr:hypothetical protein FH063_002455 [Azospirillum argentinense]